MHRGRIRRYFPNYSHGFITPQEGGEDIYFHRSAQGKFQDKIIVPLSPEEVIDCVEPEVGLRVVYLISDRIPDKGRRQSVTLWAVDTESSPEAILATYTAGPDYENVVLWLGDVVFYDSGRGYGFIKPEWPEGNPQTEAGTRDVFFHISGASVLQNSDLVRLSAAGQRDLNQVLRGGVRVAFVPPVYNRFHNKYEIQEWMIVDQK